MEQASQAFSFWWQKSSFRPTVWKWSLWIWVLPMGRCNSNHLCSGTQPIRTWARERSSLLTPLDETSRFVLLTGYSEGNSFHFKLTFNMSFQEKKKIKTKRGHWSTDGNHEIILPDDLKLQDTILTTSSCAPHSTNQLNRKCWDNQVYTDMPGRYTRLP